MPVNECSMTHVEMWAQIHITATEPVTGANVELGQYHGDKWSSIPLGALDDLDEEGGLLQWLYGDRDVTHEYYYGDPHQMQEIIDQTKNRCRQHAREILAGQRPAVRELQVWPVHGCVALIEPGQFVPAGVSHLWGYRSWVEIASLFPEGSPTSTA